MKRLVFIAIAAASLTLVSAPEVREGTGRNADYRAAVYDALAQAMSQVEGLSLEESRESLKNAYERSLQASRWGEVDLSDVKESLSQSVAANTKGRVLRYEILSAEFDQESKTWCVKVLATMPGRYVVGRDPDCLRRMVVAPFRRQTDKVTVLGESVDCARYNEEMAKRLGSYLTQTRKFSMLSRQYYAEINAELSRLDMKNASSGDNVRRNQLLVTDYMVTGDLTFHPQMAAVQNQYVVGGAQIPDSTCLEVSYSVLLAPTSQLKWSDSVKIPYSACAGSTPGEILSSAVECAAEEICEQIIDNIYPLRVAEHATNELVLDRGGKSIRAGDVFEVFLPLRKVASVSTKESLGYVEDKIAEVRVTRVEPKKSYAIVVNGTALADIPVGAIARRPAYGGDFYPPPAGATTPVETAPDGGVSVPWDR